MIVAVPALALVNRPFPFTMATETFDELQFACPVTLIKEPSLNVPIAPYC